MCALTNKKGGINAPERIVGLRNGVGATKVAFQIGRLKPSLPIAPRFSVRDYSVIKNKWCSGFLGWGEGGYPEMTARVFPFTSWFTTDLGHCPRRTEDTVSAVLRFNSLIASTE